ncbi:hypothetical protein M1345_01165 [Patescibacteria group bacterium]|nr:hypothetical protein [Patescibacteria group bacterium]
MTTGDYNNDGRIDIVAGTEYGSNNGRASSGSLYLINNNLFSQYTGTGHNVDLASSANYSVRFDGAEAGDELSWDRNDLADLNNNGKSDLVLASWSSNNNGRTYSGSVYVLYDSILESYSGTGNNVDMATSTNYNLRYDGAATDDSLISARILDFDNDGKPDLIIGAVYASNNNRASSGSEYIISDKLVNSHSGTGNNIDLANSGQYSLRYDGANAGDFFSGSPLDFFDFNGDGSLDLATSAIAASYNGANSGSLYIIYNFPHTISLSGNMPGNISTFTTKFNVAGTVDASNSVTKIANVQYSLDDNNPSSTSWKDCVASDGEFNSLSEGFSCNDISLSGLESNTKHTLYIRAQDTNGSYTAQSSYNTNVFWYGSQPDTSNCLFNFKYCLNPSGVTTANGATVLTTSQTDPSDLHVQITTDPTDTNIFQINVFSAFNGYPISPTTNPYTIILPYSDTITNPTIVYSSNSSWLPLAAPMVVNPTNKTVATTTTMTNTEFKVVDRAVETTIPIPVATPSPEPVVTQAPLIPTSLPTPPAPNPPAGGKTCFLFWCW